MVQGLRLWTLDTGDGTRSHMPRLKPGAVKLIYIFLIIII